MPGSSLEWGHDPNWARPHPGSRQVLVLVIKISRMDSSLVWGLLCPELRANLVMTGPHPEPPWKLKGLPNHETQKVLAYEVHHAWQCYSLYSNTTTRASFNLLCVSWVLYTRCEVKAKLCMLSLTGTQLLHHLGIDDKMLRVWLWWQDALCVQRKWLVVEWPGLACDGYLVNGSETGM